MTHESPGDNILAEKRAEAAKRARAADDRERNIILGSIFGIILAIAAGWIAWQIYDMHEEHVAIDQIQGAQLLHGQRVQSADEIRANFKRLEDQYGATPGEARAAVKAFQ
jgi:type VI protein secretion system component VasK